MESGFNLTIFSIGVPPTQGLHSLDEPHRADRRPLCVARLPQHQDIPQGETVGGQNSAELIRIRSLPQQ